MSRLLGEPLLESGDTAPGASRLLSPGNFVRQMTGHCSAFDHGRPDIRLGLPTQAATLTALAMTPPTQVRIARPITPPLYLSKFQDADGRNSLPRQALSQFADASRSPIYGYYDTFLGNGIVGGSMVAFQAIGRKTARLAIRILAGEDPKAAARAKSHQPVPMIDGRQLHRWNIPKDRLPSGSVVLFRQSTLWGGHKDYVIGGLAIMVAQTLTISLLLRQARRRKLAEQERAQAELEIGQKRNELAHLSRVTTVSTLSGSLAHELNQPLGIILSNAQAAQQLLNQDSPVVTEVSEILSDIVAADRRAADITQRLRTMLKRGEVSRKSLPLNDLLAEVLKLVNADLIGRGVTVICDFAPDLGKVVKGEL